MNSTFYFEQTPRSGANLLAVPQASRIPLVRTRRGHYLIPRHPGIARLSFWTAEPGKYWRHEARRLGEYLSMSGYPVFDKNGNIRVYCISIDAEDILDIFVTLGQAAGWGRGDLPSLPLADAEAVINAVQVGGKYWQWLEGSLVSQSIPYHAEGGVLTVGVRRYALPDGAELVAPMSPP